MFYRRFSGLAAATVTAASFVLSASAQPIDSNQPQSDAKFYCTIHENLPTTMAQTARGPVAVIHWKSDAFGENFPPEVRCQTVSMRFQAYYSNGTLNYLTTGELNQLPIICAVQFKGGTCGLLLTLKKGTDPNQTLRHLLNVRDRSTDVALNESQTTTFIDMKDFLGKAPVVKVNALPAAAAPKNSPTHPRSKTLSPTTREKPLW